MNDKQKMVPVVLILVAAQCDEEFVVGCFSRLRQKNIETLLVGLYAGPVIGLRGLWLRPDRHLADMEKELTGQQSRMLVLPGPDECALKLLLNPRVHELVEMTLAKGGLVAAVTPKTRDLLVRSGLVASESESVLLQGRLDAAEFIERLAAQMEF
jgi:hypothetical protein